MSRDVLYQIAYVLTLAILVAVFVTGYAWLMRAFRRHRAPQPVTFAQRWTAAFVPVVPLCLFGSYALFRAQTSAVGGTLAFGVLGALAAATSAMYISLGTRGMSVTREILGADDADSKQVEAVAAKRVGVASKHEWPMR